MPKVDDHKPGLIESIMKHIDYKFKSGSETYKMSVKGLNKLAIHELSSLLLMLETSALTVIPQQSGCICGIEKLRRGAWVCPEHGNASVDENGNVLSID